MTAWPSRRLRSNSLRDEGVIALCNALSESKVSKLQELEVQHNQIGPGGAKAIAAFIAASGSLTRLDVSHNYLDRGGAGVNLLMMVKGRKGFNLLVADNK